MGAVIEFCNLLVKLYEYSGCAHVRRLQASSELLVTDSRLDQVDPLVVEAGLDSILLDGESAPRLDEFMLFNGGAPYPCGDWNGFPADGTDNRRSRFRWPLYRLCVLEWEEIGDCMPEPHLGLFWPVEKVAEVGVLNPEGE